MPEETNLKQSVKADEIIHILNVTRTVEKGLVRMYDVALDRCVLDDVSDAYARYRDLADRTVRSVENLIREFGGEVRDLEGRFPATSFVDSFEAIDRDGLWGTFHDMLDLWFIQSRANAQWSVLKHIARTAGHEDLLRAAEDFEDETDDAEDYIERRAEEVAVDIALLAESEIEEKQAGRAS